MNDEEKHKAEVHELKALNHLKAAAILRGEEPAKANTRDRAHSPAPKPAPSGPVKELNPQEAAAYLGLFVHDFQRIRYSDPDFPKPREFTQLYKTTDLDTWRANRP